MANTKVPAYMTEAGKFGGKYAHYREEQASANGGDFTQGAWRTRVLNTEVTDEIGITLASNELSVPAGTYYFRGRGPALAVVQHQLRLYNVTDTAVILYGSVHYCGAEGGDVFVSGRFTIAGTKSIRLEHYCQSTQNSNGFGNALGAGLEVYAELELWKVD